MRATPYTSSASMPTEDHMITSRNNIWQQHTKHGHRLQTSPPSNIASNLGLVNSMPPIGCGPSTIFPCESGAIPTSSDQSINEYDRNAESPNRISQDRINSRIADIQKSCGREIKNGAEATHNNCNNDNENDNDEEVIVTNDDDECLKKIPSTKDLKRNDKNRYNSIQILALTNGLP